VTFYNIDLRMVSDERKRPCFEDGFGRWGSSLHGKSWPGVSQVTKNKLFGKNKSGGGISNTSFSS
jgi:hypothetical protein